MRIPFCMSSISSESGSRLYVYMKIKNNKLNINAILITLTSILAAGLILIHYFASRSREIKIIPYKHTFINYTV